MRFCIKVLSIFIVFSLVPVFVWADTHWVSPSGAAAWANCTGSTPLSGASACSLSTAFSNATAGDLVYLRGGTYNTGTTEFDTAHAGTGDAENKRVVFRAYSGETPNIVSTYGRSTIFVDHQYWWFDGLSIHHSGISSGDSGIIKVGESGNGSYVKITNCHLHITGSSTADNVDCIILKTNYSSYALVQNNNLEGFGTSSCGGVIYLSTGNVGSKILNNEIHNLGVGIYCKHVNGDTSFSSGAEWAYNYIYGIGPSNDGGFLGLPGWINIHDNIVVNATATNFGINGGGPNGTNCLINHNTFHGGKFTAKNESGGMINYNIKNNIIRNREIYGGSGNTWSYNMWTNDTALGSHDLGNTSPTYVGGANPTTIAGFALAAGSKGKNYGDDGKDLGADVSRVGVKNGNRPPGIRIVD
jgi:hypothetical protein